MRRTTCCITSNPKYEAQQEAYVKQLEERLRWQDDGEAAHG